MLAYLYNEEGDSKRAAQVLTAVNEPDRTAKLYSASASPTSSSMNIRRPSQPTRAPLNSTGEPRSSSWPGAKPVNDNQPDAALDQFKAIVGTPIRMTPPAICAWPSSIAALATSTRRLSR